MKRFYLFSLLLITITFLNTGCGFSEANDKAEKCADTFHKHLMNKSTNQMMRLMHEDALFVQKNDIMELFQRFTEDFDIDKVEQSMGYNTSINNGIATVTLNYTLFDKNRGEISEQIVMRDSKSGSMKIVSLQYN